MPKQLWLNRRRAASQTSSCASLTRGTEQRHDDFDTTRGSTSQGAHRAVRASPSLEPAPLPVRCCFQPGLLVPQLWLPEGTSVEPFIRVLICCSQTLLFGHYTPNFPLHTSHRNGWWPKAAPASNYTLPDVILSPWESLHREFWPTATQQGSLLLDKVHARELLWGLINGFSLKSFADQGSLASVGGTRLLEWIRQTHLFPRRVCFAFYFFNKTC